MASPFYYRDMKLLVYRKGNRRVLNSTHGGVRGRRETASYSIYDSLGLKEDILASFSKHFFSSEERFFGVQIMISMSKSPLPDFL